MSMATHPAAAATALQSECPHARVSRRPVGPRQRKNEAPRGKLQQEGEKTLSVFRIQTPRGEREPPGLKVEEKGEKLVRLLLLGATLMHLWKIGGGWLLLRAGSSVSLRTAEQKSLLKERFRKCLSAAKEKGQLSLCLTLKNHNRKSVK